MGLFFLVSVITQPQSAEARYLSYCDTSNKIEYLVELQCWLLLCRSCFYVSIKSVGGEVRKVRKSCYNSVFAGVAKAQLSTVSMCVENLYLWFGLSEPYVVCQAAAGNCVDGCGLSRVPLRNMARLSRLLPAWETCSPLMVEPDLLGTGARPV